MDIDKRYRTITLKALHGAASASKEIKKIMLFLQADFMIKEVREGEFVAGTNDGR